MNRLTIAAAFYVLSLGPCLASSRAQDVAPTVRTASPVAYPRQAERASISGDAVVNVTVEPDGTVSEVQIVSVPETGVGFEAALASIREWRFTPATRSGEPVRGIAHISVPFRLELQGDFTFDVPPDRAWQELKSLLAGFKYKTSRLDETPRLLVTRSEQYALKLLPDAEALGFRKGVALDRVTWYVSVPPQFMAARVSISTELELRDGRLSYRIYRNSVLAEWLAARLGERLGAKLGRLSDQVVERTKVSAPLSALAGGATCSPPSQPVNPMRSSVAGAPSVSMPHLLLEMKPIFPAQQLRSHNQGRVSLSAVVTEHGSMTGIKVLQPEDGSPEFKANAAAAAMMWRFSPALVNGCPAPMNIGIEMTFTIK